jgi:HEAT repeat protein
VGCEIIMKLPGRWWWLGAVAMIVLIAGGWWLIGRNREPRYEGRTVEQWFKRYYLDQDPDAPGALRAMRSNALPYLVDVAFSTNEDSALRTNIHNLLSKLPDSWSPSRFVPATEIRVTALTVIYQIKPSSRELMPLIEDALEHTNSPQHIEAVYLLGSITDEPAAVVSELVKALHETDPTSQAAVSYDIFWSVMPMTASNLVTLLRNSRPRSDPWTAELRMLGKMGSNAAPAIPLLKEEFENETNWETRAQLAAYLWRIDPGQTYAADYLKDLLMNNPTSERIQLAAGYLHYGKRGVDSAVPLLLGVLNTTNCDERATSTVLYSLRDLDAPKGQVLATMAQKLNSEPVAARESALYQLDAMGQDVRSAEEGVLGDMVKMHSDSELWAIHKITTIGTAVSIPVLKGELTSTNPDIGNAAAYAIQMISLGKDRGK